MDPQVRQFRDFLQLYNTITEKCFSSCVDSLLSRRVEENENSCVSVCVDKFTKLNQRVMGTYIEVQSRINEKRMQEYETQLKEAEAQAQAAQLQQQQAEQQQQEVQEPNLEPAVEPAK